MSSYLAFRIINNFALSDEVPANLKYIEQFRKKDGTFRIIFAGNLGRFQGLELLIEAMNATSNNKEMELVFLGEGRALKALKTLTDNDTIKFFPHMSVSDAKELIADADMGVVSLQESIINYAFPSKTMTYLEQNCPLFAIIEEISHMANFINNNEVGVVAKAGCLESVIGQLNWINNNRSRVITMKNNAKQCYRNNYSEDIVLKKWQDMMIELEAE